MGCDIHSAVEVFDVEKWNWIRDIKFPLYESERFTNEPFAWRHYNMFCFLADIYCKSSILEHLSSYRGLPIDLSSELNQGEFSFNSNLWLGEFGYGYLLLNEILVFDYDKPYPETTFADAKTYRDMLGEDFFRDIEIMKQLNSESTKIRIVFGFDN